MKKVGFILVAFASFQYGFAQINKQTTPQFRISVQPLNDTLQQLSINVVVDKRTQIFTAKKKTDDDVFICSLNVDTASQHLLYATDTVVEKGALQTIIAPTGDVYRFYNDSVVYAFLLHTANTTANKFKGSFAWMLKNGTEFVTGEEKIAVALLPIIHNNEDDNNNLAKKTLWGLFLICLITGLAAVISPCVFPLMPVTVSYFLKGSKTKTEGVLDAIWYSLSIIIIYAVPTFILTKLFGDKIMYQIATHAITNILFFLIFIVFGISLLGAFDITLPSAWANKADKQAGRNFKGIFFMALTLVIVSFSCTGPIVGVLLGQSTQSGSAIAPVVGMLGFGVGLSLPFTVFALFPSFMKSLPKSGGWLNSVKVVFGFIELALALKFLSNVDLMFHWHWLNRDAYLSIWIVLSALLGLYLLGKLKFSHDSDLPYISLPRFFLAVIAFCFAIYMVPGLWGAPLKVLSGFIPPATTQDFNLNDLQYKIENAPYTNRSNNTVAIPPKKLVEKLKAPFNLPAYFDLEEAKAAAKILKKPIMIDFTGHSCANCRKMEEEVWSNPDVLNNIKNNFVLVSLYVDEPTELPDEAQHTNAKGEKIVTEGDKNLDYEISAFGFNAQPLYMFIDMDGKPLSNIKYGYDPNIQKFNRYLKNVKATFDARQQ